MEGRGGYGGREGTGRDDLSLSRDTIRSRIYHMNENIKNNYKMYIAGCLSWVMWHMGEESSLILTLSPSRPFPRPGYPPSSSFRVLLRGADMICKWLYI